MHRGPIDHAADNQFIEKTNKPTAAGPFCFLTRALQNKLSRITPPPLPPPPRISLFCRDPLTKKKKREANWKKRAWQNETKRNEKKEKEKPRVKKLGGVKQENCFSRAPHRRREFTSLSQYFFSTKVRCYPEGAKKGNYGPGKIHRAKGLGRGVGGGFLFCITHRPVGWSVDPGF